MTLVLLVVFYRYPSMHETLKSLISFNFDIFEYDEALFHAQKYFNIDNSPDSIFLYAKALILTKNTNSSYNLLSTRNKDSKCLLLFSRVCFELAKFDEATHSIQDYLKYNCKYCLFNYYFRWFDWFTTILCLCFGGADI